MFIYNLIKDLEKIFNYKNAFELIIEAAVNHQKLNQVNPYLNSIALSLNNFFITNEFTEFLEQKSVFYKNRLISDDDSLFIQESHIPYLVQTDELCLETDKLFAYLLIRTWVNEYNLPYDIIYDKIAISLHLSQGTIEILNGFISEIQSPNIIAEALDFNLTDKNEFEKLEGKLVEENEPDRFDESLLIPKHLNSSIIAIFLTEYNLFLIKSGKSNSLLKNKQLCHNRTCIVQSGDCVCASDEATICYSDLKKIYIKKKYGKRYNLTALRAELNYKESNGIRAFNIVGQPGEIIGIIGKEGSGKTTMLEILAGVKQPKAGNIFINGYDLYKNNYQLSGLIGYVPEEDLLYHELTVRENLFLSAQLYLGESNFSVIDILVDNLLKELGLWDIRNDVTGNLKNKIIQPGQRRLLNIALELIRDPQILIIDNALSSLSMNDSSKVIEILSKFSFKGKLIITTITQTNHKIFELFDKLFVMDSGGVPVFFGNQQSLLNCFINNLPKGIAQQYEKELAVTPEIIFELLSQFRESETLTGVQSRYLNTEALYNTHINQDTEYIEANRQRKKISGNYTHPPRLEKQFVIYSIRNFKVKFSQKKELYYALFTAPLVGLVISLILRTSGGNKYCYGLNPNIPEFFFISTLIMFFIGMSLSVKEIIRERHIIKKEEHLNLSLFSYINSKIVYLFLIVAFQSVTYTFITNIILQIDHLFLKHWLVYFSIAFTGALIGLLFSSTHKTIDSILMRMVPITLIILIVFGGGWISLKKLTGTHNKYSPLISDFVVSKVAYETLIVEEFSENPYEKCFNLAETEISNGSFNTYHLLPKLLEFVQQAYEIQSVNPDSSKKLLEIVNNQFKYYQLTEDIYPFEFSENLNKIDFNQSIYNEALDYINYMDYYFVKLYNKGIERKKAVNDSLSNLFGLVELERFKQKHQNYFISQLAKNSNSRESFIIDKNQIVRLSDPVYQLPANNFGRAPLFASKKRFNNQVINTYIYNISFIWLINFGFYILLITGMLIKIFKK